MSGAIICQTVLNYVWCYHNVKRSSIMSGAIIYVKGPQLCMVLSFVKRSSIMYGAIICETVLNYVWCYHM